MKRVLVLLACCATVALTVANAQDNGLLPVMNFVAPPLFSNSASHCLGSTVVTIPLECFTFTDTKSSTSRTLTIVGKSPFDRGKTTTTVKVLVVPIIVTIGSTTFDPTATDTCFEAGTLSDVAALQDSPVLSNVTWDGGGGAGHGSMFNGYNPGTTTYNDAERRAEFFSFVGSSNYHTAFNVSLHSAVTIDSSSLTGGGNVSGSGCGTLGVLYLNPAGPTATDWSYYIQNTVIPSLGVSSDTFLLFLTHNVVLSGDNPPDTTNCCILAFHNAFFGTIPGNVWSYATMDFESAGRFGAGVTDVSIVAHEVAEWLDDPLGTNATPPWGGIGQFLTSCQSIFEEGDPLTKTLFPSVLMPDGYTYHMQELAFFSWFYNGYNLPSGPSLASIGSGGKFSGNGTFVGASQPCPSGGTYPN